VKSKSLHTTNHSGKRTIPGDSLEVVIESSAKGIDSIYFNLKKLSKVLKDTNIERDFPNAFISLYAQAHFSEQEFKLGKISSLVEPSNLSLDEIDKERFLSFRLIAFNDNNQIIASNEKLKVRKHDDPSGAESLLNVDDSIDLGEQLWKLELGDNSPPILLLNSRIPNIKFQIKENTLLLASIIPQVLKDSIIHLSNNLTNYEPGDESSFQYKWAKFLSLYGFNLSDLPSLEDESEPETLYKVIQFAEEVVSNFCFKQKFASQITQDLENSNND